MAIKPNTSVTYVDDLDGTEGGTVRTRRFTIDREMELSDDNFLKVSAALSELLDKAREIKPATKRKAAGKRRTVDSAEREYNRRVKEWARTQPAWADRVTDRGRPTNDMIAAYVDATGDKR